MTFRLRVSNLALHDRPLTLPFYIPGQQCFQASLDNVSDYYGPDCIGSEEIPPVPRQIANRQVFYPVKKLSKTQFVSMFKYVTDRDLSIVDRNVVKYTNRKRFLKDSRPHFDGLLD